MELRAPAKVNLHLAVGTKRPDGYHRIISIFQTCSLCDILNATLEEGPFSVEVTGLEGICPQGRSTLDKASLLWKSEFGLTGKLRVHVTKRIPSQAGLGGGSSDAASLILWLNEVTGARLPKERLMEFGAKIGCDVPFFVSDSRAAIVGGAGEEVTPIRAREDLEGWVIIPRAEKVSTAEAYRALDSRKEIPELESPQHLEEMYRKPLSQWAFRNDFDMVNTRPEIAVSPDRKLYLTRSGSCHILLSEGKKRRPDLPPQYEAVQVSL